MSEHPHIDWDPREHRHQWHRDPVTNEPTTCIHCGISQQQAEDEEQP